ncbi:hypothetical protein AVEN_275589-1 [Araneus ventricosus]|uniref:Uncharacterized protein n=1 Tax=Araneus ventricosus TaxID=182803 RepID=A0A4Y2KED4_ARAVE|nr:hypothetical protein AVEN_275589-1 [Araneus ventricosus]
MTTAIARIFFAMKFPAPPPSAHPEGCGCQEPNSTPSIYQQTNQAEFFLYINLYSWYSGSDRSTPFGARLASLFHFSVSLFRRVVHEGSMQTTESSRVLFCILTS